MVSEPPTSALKLTGIKSRDDEISSRADSRLTTGMKMAVTPTFCIKPETKPTDAASRVRTRDSCGPPSFRIMEDTRFITPVLSRPAPRIMTAMTAITALDANRSEEHTSELQSRGHLVCRLLLDKKKQRTHQ